MTGNIFDTPSEDLDKTTEISLSKFNFFSNTNSFSFESFNTALVSLTLFT